MQTKTNKKTGNEFETFFCEKLFSNGFWVHNLAQNQAGQPADVIAVKNGKAHLIDCKVCSGKDFPYGRVEENQDSSMLLWAECGNGIGWFALLFEDEIYMLSHSQICFNRNTRSALPASEIRKLPTLERWLEECK